MGEGEMGGGGAMDFLDRKDKKDKKDKREQKDAKGKGDASWKEPVQKGLQGIDKALDPIAPQLQEAKAITGAVAKGFEKVSERVGVTDLARDVMKKAREVAVGKAVESASGGKKPEAAEAKTEAHKEHKKKKTRKLR